MTKRELLEEVGSNFLNLKTKSAKLNAATEAMKNIDHKIPFIYAVVGISKVVCLQPRGSAGLTELYAMHGIAKELTDAIWYYWSPSKGRVVKVYREVVMSSLENFIEMKEKYEKKK